MQLIAFDIMNNNSPTQSRDHCLDLLRQRERDLNSIRVQTYWQQQPLDLANQFLQQQIELMTMRAVLENAPFQQIEAGLSRFETALIAECTKLARQVKTLNSVVTYPSAEAIAFLTTLARITSTAAKIVSRTVAES